MLNHHACSQKIASRNSSPDSGDSLDSGDSPEIVQTGPVWPWVLHAPGAKMTVVYTNSLKLEMCGQSCHNWQNKIAVPGSNCASSRSPTNLRIHISSMWDVLIKLSLPDVEFRRTQSDIPKAAVWQTFLRMPPFSIGCRPVKLTSTTMSKG